MQNLPDLITFAGCRCHTPCSPSASPSSYISFPCIIMCNQECSGFAYNPNAVDYLYSHTHTPLPLARWWSSALRIYTQPNPRVQFWGSILRPLLVTMCLSVRVSTRKVEHAQIRILWGGLLGRLTFFRGVGIVPKNYRGLLIGEFFLYHGPKRMKRVGETVLTGCPKKSSGLQGEIQVAWINPVRRVRGVNRTPSLSSALPLISSQGSSLPNATCSQRAKEPADVVRIPGAESQVEEVEK